MTTDTSTWQVSAKDRQERLERWRRMLAGEPAVASGRPQRRRNPETNWATGVWLHAAARAEMGLELTAWEQAFLAPLADVLGEEEVRAMGRAYREQRDAGAVALVPQAVTERSFDEPFTSEEAAAHMRAVGELAAGLSNVASVNRTRLLAGEQLETPEFTEAAAACGYGLTLFGGAEFGAAEVGQESAGADGEAQAAGGVAADGMPPGSLTSFRARLQWDGFRCHEAAGDQWSTADEIYWTAACSTVGYKHTTRTRETDRVSSGNEYSIGGDHSTGSVAFFDANFTGNLSAMVITCWEADQSDAAWYDALGKALAESVDSLALIDFVLNFVPGSDLVGWMITAMDFLATLWEHLQNKDDLILTRGFALNRSDVKALYYTEGRRMTLGFNARSTGMGHFSLHVKYTGDTPPGPPPEGSFSFIATNWTGLLGSPFTRDLDAACLVPGTTTDVYLFKGDTYVRYDCNGEEIRGGIRSISSGWPALRPPFTSNLDAACLVPGTTTDVYLFKGDTYVRYNCSGESVRSSGRISDGWPGLRNTPFTSNLDAACLVPGTTTDVYLFKGSEYVRYDCSSERIRHRQAITAGWPRLTDTEFAHNLQAGCVVPNSRHDVYLFKGERYVRYAM
ncbi:hypothetical protein ACGFSI_19865 [Streptomyces virginiae]|uniref:hypothetical protein n=1 Tax=Streptomyces virginiae TaxID=1961 RepID=UPI003719EEE4